MVSEQHITWLYWRADEATAVDASELHRHAGWCAVQALRWLAVGDMHGGYRWLGKAYRTLLDEAPA